MTPCYRVQSIAATAIATCVLAAALGGSAHAGTPPDKESLFERVTRSTMFPSGGRETGLLKLGRASGGHAPFRLEVTTNPTASDDGFKTRNGIIEDGVLVVHGAAATYRSAYAEDRELGSCTLNVRLLKDAVRVAQGGHCWWFGQDVDASGLYRRTVNQVPRVVQ
jgi:hypothetical protein